MMSLNKANINYNLMSKMILVAINNECRVRIFRYSPSSHVLLIFYFSMIFRFILCWFVSPYLNVSTVPTNCNCMHVHYKHEELTDLVPGVENVVNVSESAQNCEELYFLRNYLFIYLLLSECSFQIKLFCVQINRIVVWTDTIHCV